MIYVRMDNVIDSILVEILLDKDWEGGIFFRISRKE